MKSGMVKSPTLLSAGLSAAIVAATYFIYVKALESEERVAIMIFAVIYFFPILLEAVEDLESTKKRTWEFIALGVAVTIGFAFLGLIWYFLYWYRNGKDFVPTWFRIPAIVVPALFALMKFIPVGEAFWQLYSRQKGARNK